MRSLAACVILLTLVGCSRSGASAADGGTDAASGAASAAASPAEPAKAEELPSGESSARRRDVSAAPVSGLEARRSVVTRIEADPILSANADALRKQHGGAIPAALAVQATDLGADRRRAIVIASERKDGTLESPMLLVVDEHGALLWSKERPVAGIKPPVGPLAVAAGPHGRFAMAVCDPPTSTVALRLWDGDGSPFADFSVLDAKACDAISLLYWPQHGWLVALAAGAETRVQLVGARARRALPDHRARHAGLGLAVELRSRAVFAVAGGRPRRRPRCGFPLRRQSAAALAGARRSRRGPPHRARAGAHLARQDQRRRAARVARRRPHRGDPLQR
jgi:hypothetical protein